MKTLKSLILHTYFVGEEWFIFQSSYGIELNQVTSRNDNQSATISQDVLKFGSEGNVLPLIISFFSCSVILLIEKLIPLYEQRNKL